MLHNYPRLKVLSKLHCFQKIYIVLISIYGQFNNFYSKKVRKYSERDENDVTPDIEIDRDANNVSFNMSDRSPMQKEVTTFDKFADETKSESK